MPTATTLSGFTLSNVGPLTTTFTAPASCLTDYVVLGVATVPTAIEWYVTCGYLPPTDCSPDGAVVQSIVKDGEHDPEAGRTLLYNSPGIQCPAGWETVGQAAKYTSGGTTSTSTSGAFNVSDILPSRTAEIFNIPGAALLVEALEVGETAALCCPLSFTALGGANCYSTRPASVYTPTYGCLPIFAEEVDSIAYGTYTIAGETVEGGLIEITVTGSQSVTTTTTSIAASDASSYVGVNLVGMVTLVWQSTDVKATATQTGATQTGTGTSTSTKSAAVRSSIRDYHETTLGVVAVGCIALVLGSLFVL
ncbi:hypothetical protein SEUCBS139899_003846 [Sporothrix eucalyptigena]